MKLLWTAHNRSTPSFRRRREWILWICAQLSLVVVFVCQKLLNNMTSRIAFLCSSSHVFNVVLYRRIVRNKAFFTYFFGEDKINISLVVFLFVKHSFNNLTSWQFFWDSPLNPPLKYWRWRINFLPFSEFLYHFRYGKTLCPTTIFLETNLLVEWMVRWAAAAAVKKHRTNDVSHTFLWLARTYFRTKIYDMAFQCVYVSTYVINRFIVESDRFYLSRIVE